jgi:hypothetical protein
MDNKYLVLEFRNAKLFRNTKSSKDYVFDRNIRKGYRKRIDEKKSDLQFLEPITVHQISNMIHVLFNERPVPSHRDCFYKRVDHIFEKAENSYLKYTDRHGGAPITEYFDSKGKIHLLTETMTVNKAVHDCWKKHPQMNWHIIKDYIGDQDNIDWFFGEVIDLLGVNPLDYSVENVRDALLTKDLTNMFAKLKSIGRGGLSSYIINTKNAPNVAAKSSRSRIMVNSGIESITKYNGEIIVPVNDEDIAKLRESKGCATLLDGGFVTIVGVKDAHEITVDGFIKVGDISTEKY